MKQRFDYTNYDDGTSSIYDRKEDEYYFDSELNGIEELLNSLNDENELLKEQNKELKQDNDIKFWKLQLMEQ